MKIDGVTYRLRNSGERLPLYTGSFAEHLAANNGGTFQVVGMLGLSSRSHKFTASYIELHGEKVAIHFYSKCGSVQFQPGTIHFIQLNGTPSCSKCAK